MDKSYFVYKSEIKEEVKETFERLKHYEKILIYLESKKNNYPEKQKIENQERIEVLREYISEIKKRLETKTNIYFYG